LSSRFEGLPIVLLDSQALGLPCVFFNCPTGPAEVIENGVNGFLIDCFYGNPEKVLHFKEPSCTLVV
jgi:glycosyltransferase involved in cell wall biosynthesis